MAEERNRTPTTPQGKSRKQSPQTERQRNQEQRRRSCYRYCCPRTQNHEESRDEQTRTAEAEHAQRTNQERQLEATEPSKGPDMKQQQHYEQPRIAAEQKTHRGLAEAGVEPAKWRRVAEPNQGLTVREGNGLIRLPARASQSLRLLGVTSSLYRMGLRASDSSRA